MIKIVSRLLLQISWIRMRDWHILTNGALTYTSDSRFSVLHKVIDHIDVTKV